MTAILLLVPAVVVVAQSRTYWQFASIRDVRYIGGRWYAVVDYMSMFTGREADRAAVADGVIPAGERAPNDYYIRNRSKRLRRIELSPRVVIRLFRTSSAIEQVTAKQLRRIVRDPEMWKEWYGIADYGVPCRLELTAGTICDVEQVYFP